jgi:hypothetical protein
MSTYRFLQDHDIGGAVYLAGTTAATMDVGGTLPAGWRPSGQVDPLDGAAVQDFWNAGVQLLGSVRAQWTGVSVAPPATYWVPYPAGGGTRPYILTGLGAGLPFRNWIEPRGAVP